MPLFFVNNVIHGSSCPSQRGAAGLVNSLDHESLDTIGSWTEGSLLAELVFEGDGKVVMGSMPCRSFAGVCVPGLVDWVSRILADC